MSSGLRWWLGSVIALVVLLTYLTIANFFSRESQEQLQWVVSVDLESVPRYELEFLREALRDALESEDVTPALLVVREETLVVAPAGPEDAEVISRTAGDFWVLEEVGSDGGEVSYGLKEERTQEIRERAMLQVLEVLRRRIHDPVRGIPSSMVTRQGDDRVLVQIPSGQIDRSRARKLIESTGFLEFKIVIDRAANEEALRAKHPDGIAEDQMIAFERDPETQAVLAAYLLSEAADVTGDYCDDFRVGFDPQQRPLVNFRFSPEGGRIFAELTEANIGKRLAIIIEGSVYSAPMIMSRISQRGQITGRFTAQEAVDLAMVLRAGALAVPVVIEEERTVVPTLE